MKVTDEELQFQISCLRRGLRAGYKDFKIDGWFAEFIVEHFEEEQDKSTAGGENK